MLEVEFRSLNDDRILCRVDLPSVPSKGDPVRIGVQYYVVTSCEWWVTRNQTASVVVMLKEK